MVNQKTLRFFLLFLFLSLRAIASEFQTPQEIFPMLQSILKNQQSDFFQHSVKRKGNKKISLEAFISIEADWKLVPKIAQQISLYPKWVLPRINDKGGGEKFYIQFSNLTADPKDPSNINVDLILSLPGLKIPISRVFHFEYLPGSDPSNFIIKVTALESKDSPVKDLFGSVYLFRAPQNSYRVWAYLDFSVVLNHWLVYESLPERLLNREAGDRIRILMEEYQTYENSFH
jgi:hypothetical protein